MLVNEKEFFDFIKKNRKDLTDKLIFGYNVSATQYIYNEDNMVASALYEQQNNIVNVSYRIY
jgi:hypothetical protein